jgi:hypothetical protein
MTTRKQYLKALRRGFKKYAPIYPPSEILELGDYGIYKHGEFTTYGNLFKDLNLDLKEFEDKTKATASAIILSESATQTHLEGNIEEAGAHVGFKIDFKSEGDYMLQLVKYTTESFALSNKITDKLIEKMEELRWKRKYRIVSKRLICKNLYFTYSEISEANLKITGNMPESLNVADISYSYKAQKGINSDLRVDKGKATPAVDFVRFKPKNEIIVPTRDFLAESDLVGDEKNLVPYIDNFDEDTGIA